MTAEPEVKSSDLNLAVVMSSLAQGKNNNPQVGQGEFTG
jgi:hypothetical protein